jgi:enoyl-CoA hydratase
LEAPVRYDLDQAVAHITMDDGKVNVLSPRMLGELNGALDRATSDGAGAVVVRGREGVFSAGFDLPTLRGGGTEALAMLQSGFELAERILSFPLPVAMGCTGHAIAMGAFLLLSGDYRVGVDGLYRITANEVAIGLTLPRAAIEICRQRLSPAAFNRATILAEVFSPDDAVVAGFLDRTVEAPGLSNEIAGLAAQMVALDTAAHAATKLRARSLALQAIRKAIEEDMAEFAPA